MTEDQCINVEVVYAMPHAQTVIAIRVPIGTTVAEAIARSGMLEKYPELDIKTAMAGIYGRRTELTLLLTDNDRVEIYRPLMVDPKLARRGRARRKTQGTSNP